MSGGMNMMSVSQYDGDDDVGIMMNAVFIEEMSGLTFF